MPALSGFNTIEEPVTDDELTAMSLAGATAYLNRLGMSAVYNTDNVDLWETFERQRAMFQHLL